MSQSHESSIHRHPDGSIDIGYYGSQAMRTRTDARTEAVKCIVARLMQSLAKLPEWFGLQLPKGH